MKSNSADKRIASAITNLIFTHPFFATLAFRLERSEDPTVPSMATNGVHLKFNADFVNSLPSDELEGVLAHEIMHCANGHPWRRGAREPRRWNQACDYAINPILQEEGFKLPKGGLNNPAYKGMSAEKIYTLLSEMPSDGSGQGQQGQGGSGDKSRSQGNSAPGTGSPDEDDDQIAPEDIGQVTDPGPGESPSNIEADWQVAVMQAANVAKGKGRLPAFAKRLIEEIRKPKVDWRSVLRRFVQECAKADYSWKMPNRNYIAQELYLPSLRSEQMPPMVIGGDTSGSISGAVLNKFGSEMQSIIDECQPEKVTVMWWDAKVQKIDEFQQGEPLVLSPKGGGGTMVGDVFKQIEQGGTEPACLIILTDMMIGDLDRIQAPSYPVLWASTTERAKAPFGEFIYIGEGE